MKTLTDRQEEVLEMMSKGHELRHSFSMGRVWLDGVEGKVYMATFNSLWFGNLIVRTHVEDVDTAYETYVITDKGREALK